MFKNFEANHREEMIQKCAWRLVRSAEDRIGAGRGPEKLIWAMDRLKLEFPDLAASTTQSRAEDYIRAAFTQFKTEAKAYA